ncbi:MAG: polysaccharide biosynthesis C-terminal domain-containing protein [Bacteroidetes bacterium]|nr:polysaccharide biosynthesis C-terminal domain-containing protein [Bacteroidota bacterium]
MSQLLRQGSKNTVYLFLGVGLGFISSALLQPRLLSPEQNGVIKLLVSYSAILAHLFTLGFPAALIKYKTEFKVQKLNDLSITLGYTLLGIGLFVVMYLVFGRPLFELLLNSESAFWSYIHYLPAATLVTLVYFNLDAFARTELYSTPGTLLKEVGQRLLVLLALAGTAWLGLSYLGFLYGYVLALAFPALALLFFLVYKRLWKPTGFATLNMPSGFRNRVHSVAAYSIVSGLSASFIVSLDAFFIERMIGTADTGVYAVFAYFATLILIPYRGLDRIASPVIAQALSGGDEHKIADVYKISAKYLLLFGGVLMAILASNRHNIAAFLPEEYRIGLPVLIWLGFSNLIDAATGINTSIIGNSKYYRFNTYLLLGLILLASGLNYWFIPVWGIEGAAAATLISIALYNIVKLIFIGRVFGMWPWHRHTLFMVLIPGLGYLASEILPLVPNLYFDTLMRTMVILAVVVVSFRFKKLYPSDWKL